MAGLYALLFVGLLPAPAHEATPPKTVAEALKPFVDNQTLAGAVTLVADRGKVLHHEAIGYADVSGQRPMLVNALFWIASMSKPITAAALMILVDEGKVKLDDPIEKYLPEFKGQWVIAEMGKDQLVLRKPKRLVTVRDVMNHTSGLAFRSAMETPTIDVLSLQDAVRSYALTPLNSEPGTKFVYSNAGINIGGRIIEVVSGMAYEDFLDKRLFGPLGMKDTTFWPNGEQLKRLAKSYKPGKDKTGLVETPIVHLKYPIADRKRGPCPAGGFFSTASDIGAFCQMVLNDGEYNGKRILSEKAVKQMTSRTTEAGVKANWGVGWSITGDGEFGHGGAFATNMSVDTKRGLVFVWMVQHNGFPGNGGQSQAAFRAAARELYTAK
ncbi:MAG: beta-lactamase family protein [Planctomycetes bacterium]|nr:beta-lactamase family protein [Planctomycetota bacterium]